MPEVANDYSVVVQVPCVAGGISWRWVVCSLAVAQLGAVFWAVTPMVGWGHYGAEPHGTSCTVAWGEQLNVSFTVSLFIFALFVPVAVMVCAYWAIVRHIRQEGSEATTWADIRMMKVLFFHTFLYMLMWVLVSISGCKVLMYKQTC